MIGHHINIVMATVCYPGFGKKYLHYILVLYLTVNFMYFLCDDNYIMLKTSTCISCHLSLTADTGCTASPSSRSQ